MGRTARLPQQDPPAGPRPIREERAMILLSDGIYISPMPFVWVKLRLFRRKHEDLPRAPGEVPGDDKASHQASSQSRNAAAVAAGRSIATM